jgi:hypothetical protein
VPVGNRHYVLPIASLWHRIAALVMLEGVFLSLRRFSRPETIPTVTKPNEQPEAEAPAIDTPSPQVGEATSGGSVAPRSNGDATPSHAADPPAELKEPRSTDLSAETDAHEAPTLTAPNDPLSEETVPDERQSPVDGPAIPSVALVGPPAPLAFVPPAASLSPLELRVKHLEEAVAALQAARVKEDRIITPSPVPVVARSTDTTTAPRPPSSAVIPTAVPTVPPAPSGIRPAVATATHGKRPWLVWEIIAEFRVILRMFVDPRYSMTWIARLVPLALALLILTSGLWGPWSYIPLVGWLFDKSIDLVMAFVLFKVLGHEARRYREISPDLPPSLRL